MIRNAVVYKASELNIAISNLLAYEVICCCIETAGDIFGNHILVANASKIVLSEKKVVGVDFVADDTVTMEKLKTVVVDKLSKEGCKLTTDLRSNVLVIGITLDDIYSDVTIRVIKQSVSQLTFKSISFNDALYNDKQIFIGEYPAESQLALHMYEIYNKMELINDMSHFYSAYQILNGVAVNGRKYVEALEERMTGSFNIGSSRVEMLHSYRDYKFMNKKWNAYLRQRKMSAIEFCDIIDCLYEFNEPIIRSVESGEVFLGDWMPQLKRFLD